MSEGTLSLTRATALTLAASAVAAGRLSAQTPDELRIASPPFDGNALAFYAAERGFYKEAGLLADVQLMANGETVSAAVVGRAIDIGCGEAGTVIVANSRGIPLTLVGVAGLQTPEAAIGKFFVPLAAKTSSGRDLDGKTVALPGLNGSAQYALQNWIDKTGGDSRTVKFVQLAGPQMAPALQDGRIDGANVPEPYVSLVAKVARPVVSPMSFLAPYVCSGVFFADIAWAKAHVDTVRRFQSAIRRAADWANSNHDQSALILERVAKLSPELVQASTRAHFGDHLDPSYVQPLIDVIARYRGFPSFPASRLIFQAEP